MKCTIEAPIKDDYTRQKLQFNNDKKKINGKALLKSNHKHIKIDFFNVSYFNYYQNVENIKETVRNNYKTYHTEVKKALTQVLAPTPHQIKTFESFYLTKKH